MIYAPVLCNHTLTCTGGGHGKARQKGFVFSFALSHRKTAVVLLAGCLRSVGVIAGNQKSKAPLFPWAGGVVTNDWCIMSLLKKSMLKQYYHCLYFRFEGATKRNPRVCRKT